MNDSALLARRHRLPGRGAPLFHDRPPHRVRGAGVPARDGAGRRRLDACNTVPHAGYCHPRVGEARARQAAPPARSTRYPDERILDCAEAGRATFGESLARVVFRCSGTEASGRAPGIARACTGNDGVIVTDFRHHGNSATIAALSTAFAEPAGVDRRVRTITAPASGGAPDAGAASAALADARAALP